LKQAELDPKVLADDYLINLARVKGCELSTSCAIVGGFWAQEIFKVLAKKEVPFKNFFCHDAWNATATIMNVQ
jgi:hypothetical protein